MRSEGEDTVNRSAAPYREQLNLRKSEPSWATFADNLLSLKEALDNQEWKAPAKHPIFSGAYFLAGLENEVESAVDASVLTGGSIGSLRRRYEFGEGTEVESFLERHLFLTNVLLSAYEKIHEYFDPDSQLGLKVVNDPDAGEDQRMFVLIWTSMSPEDALDQLDELYEDWWLNALPDAGHKLSIDVEYL